MTIAGQLLAHLQRFAACGPLPRVRALHLPPPAADGSKDGEFCALELDDGALGLSYVLLDQALQRLRAGGDLGLAGADALAVARGCAQRGLQRLLGFAAVNALTASLFARAGYVPDDSIDSIGALAPQAGDRIGMIGLFRSLVPRFVAAGAQLTVLELKPELAGAHDGWRVTLDPAELRHCNKILSTSTILLNDTVDAVVGHCAAAQAFALVGPGAGCLPDPLFARGVTVLGGTRVIDRAAFVELLRSGRGWSTAARKFTLAPASYPGVDALLTRSSRG